MKNEWCNGKDFKIIKNKKFVKRVFKNSRGMMAEDYIVLSDGMYNSYREAFNVKRIYIQCNRCKRRFYSSVSNCMDGLVYHELPKHKVR